ncbi:MAG TPA: glycosyltransferase [Ktedonobacteraceae bacterium]|jgi:hypothetical protein
MSTDTIRRELWQDHCALGIRQIPACSIGIMAYNEEANIARTLQAVLEQCEPALHIQEIIVVASGCTDRTAAIVAERACADPRIKLCIQEKREGKASAINLFLKQARSPLLLLLGADVVPAAHAFAHLCAPFADPMIGMVGGCPVPINDPATFMGHTVHLLWRLHDCLARRRPKLGEIIAFRHIIPNIAASSAVDEISIQALVAGLGYGLVYQPACIVYNKGPLTIRDFLKQRRRIYAGHLSVRKQQRYEASTMHISPIFRQLLACHSFALCSPRHTVWTLGAILLEACARALGCYDFWRQREHHIWQMATSTKDFGLWSPPAERAERSHATPGFFTACALSSRKVLPGLRQTRDRDQQRTQSAQAIRTLPTAPPETSRDQ